MQVSFAINHPCDAYCHAKQVTSACVAVPEPSPSASSVNTVGIAVGVSVGGVAFIALVVAAVWMVSHKKKKRIAVYGSGEYSEKNEARLVSL